ncbi:AsmA family protein [Thioclava sp.]|uniref:AsmA family protein n=1 Tax=Thioclava sp. TaxID=1933450 RepID=UPI003AA7EDBC
MRWIVRIIGLVVVLVLTALGALMLIPSNKIAKLAEGQFEAATGRKITLTGEVHATIWPQLGVRTGPVTIANADWAKDGPMLSAKGLEIGIDPSSLFGGDIRVSKVNLLSPDILLERRKDGTGNWAFTPPTDPANAQATSSDTSAASKSGTMQGFSLDKGTVSDGTVTWVDQESGQRLTLSKLDATLEIPSYTGPANLSFKAETNGNAITLSGTLGEFANFVAGKIVPADLALGVGPSTASFKGNLGTSPMSAQGAIAADLKNPAALATVVGQAAPDLPNGLGHDTITATGDITLAPAGSLHLRGGKITLDGNALSGAADVTFVKGKPTINAQIEAGALDLSPLTGSGSGGDGAKTSGTKSASGWSTDSIDASALHAVDAKIALSASSINLGVSKLGQTNALITLENGRAVADLRQVSAYDGKISGQLVANARGGLSAAANLVAKGVSMEPLLTDLADYKRLDAKADLTVKLLASGNSPAALAQSLSGSGNVSLGKGALQGLDLVGMLRTLNLNYVGEGAKTIFDKISASFTIDKGVLSNDDLALTAPLLSAAGKGRVNIGAQTLDYTVTATALSKDDGSGGVKVPLDITGPWAKPKFRVDVDSISSDKIDAAKDKLEDKAKTEVSKKLGITLEDGQKPEDAVRQKLEDEAKKGLLKLFK